MSGTSALTDVLATLSYNCADGVYNAELLIQFSGAPCGLKITSSRMADAKQVKIPQSPYAYTLTGLAVAEGDPFTVTVGLYSDVACTALVEEKTYNLTAPAPVCEKTTSTTLCLGEELQLSSSVDAEFYRWTIEADTLELEVMRSYVSVPEQAGNYRYSVTAYKTVVNAAANLMVSGGFENADAFSSDYLYVGIDPHEYYDSHAEASNLWALSHDASWFSHYYEPVLPHSGSYFGLFDAGEDGYAWKAETRDNPKLILEKGSVYLFSYWAAYPNRKADNSPAQLQFVISYKDAGNTWKTEKLGNVHVMGNAKPLNAWELREVRWKAPASSSEVMIGVFDQNKDKGGNDFCLDDIMFQKTTAIANTVIHRTVFVVEPHPCDPPCPVSQTVSADTTLCLNTVFPVLWRGFEVSGFGEQQFVVLNNRGCDSIIYSLNVLSRVCDPCEGVVPVQITFDTLVCDTTSFPVSWRGLSFREAGSRKQITKSSLGCDSILSVFNLSLTQCPVLCVGIEMYAKWKDVIFVPDPDLVYVSYQWYHDEAVISGATEQSYYDSEGLSGSYHCVMHTRSGGVVEACPADFDDLTRSADLNPGATGVQPVSRQSWWISPHIRIVVTTYSDHSVSAEKQLFR